MNKTPEPVLQTFNLPEEEQYFVVHTLSFTEAPYVFYLEFNFLPDWVMFYTECVGPIKIAWGTFEKNYFIDEAVVKNYIILSNNSPLILPGFARELSVYSQTVGDYVTITAYKGFEQKG